MGPKVAKGKKGKKGGKKGKKKGGKEKKKGTTPGVAPQNELELKITDMMMKRIKKKPRPYKVLLDQWHIVEELNNKMLEPFFFFIEKGPKKQKPVPQVEKEPTIEEKKRRAMEEKQNGKWQESPIDIETKIIKVCNFYKRLNFGGLLDFSRQTTIWNTGMTAKGNLEGDVFLSEGPLYGRYRMDNFHLHFGKTACDGSEHTINGKRFALELHIEFLPELCENCPEDLSEKRAKKVVLALLFKVKEDKDFHELFSLLPNIAEEGNKRVVMNNLLVDFKGALSTSEYYNYTGSCPETKMPNVEWMIFRRILSIQKNHMTYLWNLRKEKRPEKSNVSSLKARGERAVYFPVYDDHLQCRKQTRCECLNEFFFRPELLACNSDP